MEMGTITNFISSVGFPIMCCVGMGYYINTTMKEFTKTMQNNTTALEKLVMKLDESKEV